MFKKNKHPIFFITHKVYDFLTDNISIWYIRVYTKIMNDTKLKAKLTKNLMYTCAKWTYLSLYHSFIGIIFITDNCSPSSLARRQLASKFKMLPLPKRLLVNRIVGRNAMRVVRNNCKTFFGYTYLTVLYWEWCNFRLMLYVIVRYR